MDFEMRRCGGVCTVCCSLWVISFLCGCHARPCLPEDSPSAVPLSPDTNCTAYHPDVQQSCCTSATEATKANLRWCAPLPWRKSACQGGFFLNRTENKARPCPEGFYCPTNILCIVPCPIGSYCVRSHAIHKERNSTKPLRRRNRLGCKQLQNETICCEPDYETLQFDDENPERLEKTTCGGPKGLHTVICPKGYFCPTPAEKIACPRGHYCRAGSTSPHECSWLTRCPERTSAPIVNGKGLLIDLVLLLVLVVVLCIAKYRHRLRERCMSWRERQGARKRLRKCNRDDEALETDGVPCRQGSRSQQDLLSTPLMDLPQKKHWQYMGDPESQISPKAFTLKIEFNNLSLKLKGSGRVVLQNVTGYLRPKALTAIMGGSGAGKTTLLNTLSGKAYYGSTSGQLLINGQPDNISRYRSVTGFVPQDDIMHRNLTVQEVLLYQGFLRQLGVRSLREIRQNTKDIMSLLGLTAIRKSVIGDEETRGISGGQRKRVNIGMELVADPTLLFLDEPTSGLDSVSSKEVCDALGRIAEEGHLTIAAVLHQPRYEIFNMFHEIILLQPGGTIAFQGTTTNAKAYFQSLGYHISPNVNPADFYLDTIACHNKQAVALQRQSVTVAEVTTSPSQTMSEIWKEKRMSFGAVSMESETDSGRINCEPFKARRCAPFYLQLFFFLKRCFVLQYRSIHTLVLDQFLVLIAGAGLGGLYSEVILDRMMLLLTMVSLSVSLTSMLPALRCFGNDRPVFWRESSAGVNRVMYFLAVNLSQIPIILVTPLVFLSVFYTLVSPRSLFKDWYLVVLTTVWTTHGIGYAISTLFSQRSAQLASVVFVLISCMMSGATPTLCSMDAYSVIGPLLYSLSYARWLGEALFEKEANRYPPVLALDVAYNAGRQGFSLNAFTQCVIILFCFGLASRLLALLCLLFRHRGQQQ